MRTRNLGWVKFLGRWRSENSLAHYVREATAASVHTHRDTSPS